ncbi:hypothetical protein BKA56DRAFT_586094 [Ilyonectria sp. MPI-CAGE-AT-0026]|nr:hypothetical protein BKA56DRAFT_586094 [Ilyonectria sp. MPI-CAGE-AT-0026]
MESPRDSTQYLLPRDSTSRPSSPSTLTEHEDDQISTSAQDAPLEHGQHEFAATATDNLLRKKTGEMRIDPLEILPSPRVSTGERILPSIILVTFIAISALSIAFWLVDHVRRRLGGDFIAAKVIGGRFSSTWAKLVDAAASIILAPALLAFANWHIFRLTRLCAVDERPLNNRAVSLKALAEVAQTNWGSYSPFKHCAFIKSRDPQLICLALITVLSALSFSLLSNVVAYEAKDFAILDATEELEFLDQTPGWHLITNAYGGNLYEMATLPSMTDQQEDEFKGQVRKLLWEIGENPPQSFSQGVDYLNISQRAQGQMPKVRRILDVPTVRVTTSCTPSTIDDVKLSVKTIVGTVREVTIDLSTNSATNSSKMVSMKAFSHSAFINANWETPSASDIVSEETVSPLVAFKHGTGSREFWVGGFWAPQGRDSGATCRTRTYGDLEVFNFDESTYLAKNTEDDSDEKEETQASGDWSFCGVSCVLRSQLDEAVVDPKTWSTKNADFSGVPAQDLHGPLMLKDLQYLGIFDSLGFNGLSGLGPVSFKILVDSGAMKPESYWSQIDSFIDTTVWFEVQAREAAFNLVQEERNKDLVYAVRTEKDGQQLYAITFVPWIILSGLFALGTASLLTVVLTISSSRLSFRNGRILDPIKLTMDVGAIVDNDVFEQLTKCSGEEIDAWAEKTKLRYEVVLPRVADTETATSGRGVLRLQLA